MGTVNRQRTHRVQESIISRAERMYGVFPFCNHSAVDGTGQRARRPLQRRLLCGKGLEGGVAVVARAPRTGQPASKRRARIGPAQPRTAATRGVGELDGSGGERADRVMGARGMVMAGCGPIRRCAGGHARVVGGAPAEGVDAVRGGSAGSLPAVFCRAVTGPSGGAVAAHKGQRLRVAVVEPVPPSQCAIRRGLARALRLRASTSIRGLCAGSLPAANFKAWERSPVG